MGALALLAWVLLFGGGVLVGTEPFRKKLSESPLLTTTDFFYNSFVVLSCYTVTNVALLCCISSLLGGLYRAATRPEAEIPQEPIVVNYLPYVIQGFVVYLLLVSGLFLLGEDPFKDANLSQGRYTRLAGTSSLFCFLAGYKPRMFFQWIERLNQSTPVARAKARH